VKECWLESKESDDFGPDLRLHRPTAPIIQIGFEMKMDEAVPQRPGHREVHTAL
jgi:hypothetical protein